MKRTTTLFLMVWLCLFLFSGEVETKLIKGKVESKQDIEFLGSFFLKNSDDNVIDYEISYPLAECCYRLVIFDQSFGQWGSIRGNEESLTCVHQVNRVADLDFKIKLSADDRACHHKTDDDGVERLVCQERINFGHKQRPQWYFVTLANCRTKRRGLHNVTFSLHMMNGKHGLTREFEENKKFIMETDLAFLLGYAILLIFGTRFRYVLSRKKLLHLTYRLFYSSLFLKTLCLLLLNIELARFARTGLETTTMQDAAEIISCLSSIFFFSVLILVSKGYTVTRAQVSRVGTVKTFLYGMLYAACYGVVFVDQRVNVDPRDVIASLTSMSASGLIAVQIFGCTLLVFGCFFTIKNHPRKALFYVPFTLFFSVWFMAEPAYRLLAIYEYDILRSPNICNAIDLALSFAGHAYFIYLTRPNRLNKRFPFHLRTGKVSAGDLEDDDLDHPYRPADEFYTVFQCGPRSVGMDTAVPIDTDSDPPVDTDVALPIETDVTQTILDDPEHFLTPVLPFNATSKECLVIPRPTPTVALQNECQTEVPTSHSPPIVPTVSATVAANTHRTTEANWFQMRLTASDLGGNESCMPATRCDQDPRPQRVAATPTVSRRTSATATGFATMPHVVAHPKIRSTELSRQKGYPCMTDIPEKDRAAVGISTVAVPKGGFDIFTVQKRQDILDPKAPDAEKAGPMQTKTRADQDIPDSPKARKKDIAGPMQNMACVVQSQDSPTSTKASNADKTEPIKEIASAVEQNFLPPVIPPCGFLTSPSKTMETGKALDKPLQTKVSGESTTAHDKPNESSNNYTVRQIIVRPADEPLKMKVLERSTSNDGVSLTKGRVQLTNFNKATEAIPTKAIDESPSDTRDSNGRHTSSKSSDEVLKINDTGKVGSDARALESMSKRTSRVRVINVRPADKSYEYNFIRRSNSDGQAVSNEGLSKESGDVPVITVGSSEEFSKSKEVTGPESVPEPPSVDIKEPISNDYRPQSGKAATDSPTIAKPGWPMKIQSSPASLPHFDPVKLLQEVPAPKIQNWTTEPFEPQDIGRSKSSPGLIYPQNAYIKKLVLNPTPQLTTSRQGILKTDKDPERRGPKTSQEETLKKTFQDTGEHTSLNAGQADEVPELPIQPLPLIPKIIHEEVLKNVKDLERIDTPIAVPAQKVQEIAPISQKSNGIAAGILKNKDIEQQSPLTTVPGDQTIGPRSTIQGCLPAADGGDSPKIMRKLHREPTYRRYPKPVPAAQNTPPDASLPDDPSKIERKPRREPTYRRFPKPDPTAQSTPIEVTDQPQKAMDPKTKKKRLKRFLKLARKNKKSS